MASPVNAPFFHGEGESFSNYDHEVQLARRATDLESAKRASALILIMDPVVREFCVAAGGGRITDPPGAMKVAQLLND